jgi:Fe-S-cluster formation regulator IscX/YfhJ
MGIFLLQRCAALRYFRTLEGGAFKRDWADTEHECSPLADLQPSLDPKLIGLRATQKWVKEFRYFRATATGKLARFMDYVA